jgi:hypothetical protein
MDEPIVCQIADMFRFVSGSLGIDIASYFSSFAWTVSLRQSGSLF